MAINKKMNEYARLIDAGIYEKMPKAVLAAIAVSYYLNNDDYSLINEALLKEWQTLHDNGIVSQKPPKLIK